MKRNQEALQKACAKYAPGNTVANCMVKMNADKAKGGVVAAAREQLPMLKAFVVEKDLVSIPGKEEAEVRESPPYNRQNSAYIDIPGTSENGLPSVFYISPPVPPWSQVVNRKAAGREK